MLAVIGTFVVNSYGNGNLRLLTCEVYLYLELYSATPTMPQSAHSHTMAVIATSGMR